MNQFIIFIILSLLFLALSVRTLLWNLQNWQIREYRLDRMFSYLRTKQGFWGIFTLWFKPGILPRPKRSGRILLIGGFVFICSVILFGIIFYISQPYLITEHVDMIDGRVPLSSYSLEEIIFLSVAIIFITERLIWFTTFIGVFLSAIPVKFQRKRIFAHAKYIIDNSDPTITKIGIAGSYGKSSTKEILYHILTSEYGSDRVLYNPENQNHELAIARLIIKNKEFFKTSTINNSTTPLLEKGEIEGILFNQITNPKEIKFALEAANKASIKINDIEVSIDEKHFDTSQYQIYTLKKDQKLIGVARTKHISASITKQGVLIVFEEERNNGYGTKFMEHIIQAKKDKGYKKIQLWSRPQAYDFYKRLEFSDLEKFIETLEGNHPDIKKAKPLELSLQISNFSPLTSPKIFLFETGAYRRGEIRKIAEVIRPEIGIITGLNAQHIELFGSQRNIQLGKFELAENCTKKVFFNTDNELTKQIFDDKEIEAVKIGISKSVAKNINAESNQTSFSVYGKKFILPWPGAFFVENALLCLETAREIGVLPQNLVKHLKSLPIQERALQVIKRENNTLLFDLYSQNPDGTLKAIEHLGKEKGEKHYIGMPLLELADLSDETHEQIFSSLKKINATVYWIKDDHKKLGKAILGKNFIPIVPGEEKDMERLQSLTKESKRQRSILLEGRIPESIVKIFK